MAQLVSGYQLPINSIHLYMPQPALSGPWHTFSHSIHQEGYFCNCLCRSTSDDHSLYTCSLVVSVPSKVGTHHSSEIWKPPLFLGNLKNDLTPFCSKVKDFRHWNYFHFVVKQGDIRSSKDPFSWKNKGLKRVPITVLRIENHFFLGDLKKILTPFCGKVQVFQALKLPPFCGKRGYQILKRPCFMVKQGIKVFIDPFYAKKVINIWNYPLFMLKLVRSVNSY